MAQVWPESWAGSVYNGRVMAETQCTRSLLLAAGISLLGVLPAAVASAQPEPAPPRASVPGDPMEELPAEAEPDEPVFPVGDEDGQAEGPDEKPEPWADGVPPEKQERASMLYREANKLVEITSVAAAVEKYRQALVYWDHPMIRYNLAVVLMEVERPIEAYEHIVAALRFGASPLGPANHKRAMRDRRALQARLVSVVVRCARPGVEISLDGQTVLQGPGEKRLLIKPGQHELRARGGGFRAVITSHPLWPDRHYDIAVDPAKAVKRRWRPLVTWTVLGTGLGLSAAGGFLHWRARQNFEDFDEQIAEDCSDGCEQVPDELTGLQSRAKTQNRAAGVLYVVGGGMAVTGAVLWFLNRPRQVDREAFEVGEGGFDVALTPVVSEGAVGLRAAGSF